MAKSVMNDLVSWIYASDIGNFVLCHAVHIDCYLGEIYPSYEICGKDDCSVRESSEAPLEDEGKRAFLHLVLML